MNVRGIDGALRAAGADDRMDLVDKEDDLRDSERTSLHHVLHSLLKLAAVLGARDHRGNVERHDRPVERSVVRYVAVDDTLCARPSTTAVLPTPGSPIRHGLFFVRRDRICMTRSVSLSRPMIGSIFPRSRASAAEIACRAATSVGQSRRSSGPSLLPPDSALRTLTFTALLTEVSRDIRTDIVKADALSDDDLQRQSIRARR